jgi:hypothetical protein
MVAIRENRQRSCSAVMPAIFVGLALLVLATAWVHAMPYGTDCM